MFLQGHGLKFRRLHLFALCTWCTFIQNLDFFSPGSVYHSYKKKKKKKTSISLYNTWSFLFFFFFSLCWQYADSNLGIVPIYFEVKNCTLVSQFVWKHENNISCPWNDVICFLYFLPMKIQSLLANENTKGRVLGNEKAFHLTIYLRIQLN